MEAVILSATSASEMALLGRSTLPETNKCVELTAPKLAAVPNRFVEEAAKKLVLVANKLVEVILVKIPVDGVVPPIGVLLIVPPEIVRPSTTLASVTE